MEFLKPMEAEFVFGGRSPEMPGLFLGLHGISLTQGLEKKKIGNGLGLRFPFRFEFGFRFSSSSVSFPKPLPNRNLKPKR